MSTVAEEHASTTGRNQRTTPAQRMPAIMAAVRVAFTWFGVRKTLTSEQKSQAAEPFGAEGEFLSAGKKLLDTTHPAFKAVTAVRNRINSYGRGISLPFPEPGIRLIIPSKPPAQPGDWQGLIVP